MKSTASSNVTLRAEDLKLVVALQKKLKARTKVEVVRRGLRLLEEIIERERLSEAYRRASAAVHGVGSIEIEGLDPLVFEGLARQ